MRNEVNLQYLIYNGKIYPTTEINFLNETTKPSIYEVIRVIDGIPLYLEEHLNRLRKSAKLFNLIISRTDKELTEEVMKLIEINRSYNLNIKILCYGRGTEIEDIYVYFIDSFYPTKAMYREGIHTIFYKTEREHPNAKTSNYKLRERINQSLRERNAYEALLINDEGYITEGSRSNVFFIKKEKLFTPPSNKVLLGITRTKIIELCKLHNIDVIEKEISIDSLEQYEGAFITGTSVNVLPIRNMDNIQLNSSKNDIIIKVMDIYKRDKKDYILKKKNYCK